MNRLTLDQILPFDHWVNTRPVLRPLLLNAKERRRLAVGPHITLLFENAQTVWYQIEEMVRVEHLTDPELVRHEMDTYNELIPHAGELSATMFIEYADPTERDVALRKLLGIEQHLFLRVGDRRVQAEFEGAQIAEDVVSAVQFVRFAVGGRTGERFIELADAGSLAIEIDHPELRVSAPISGDLARALSEDLQAS
jgi:hypothetical protein